MDSATMRVVVAHGAGDLRLEERPVPVPGPGEVAVDIRYGGICGSDLHYWRHGAVGEFRIREPLVLGHEVVGRVREVGPGTPAPAPGTPVAVHPLASCGSCRQCLAGRRNTCLDTGYLGSAARDPHVQGGFADVIVVPAERVLPLPHGLDLRLAAVAEPAAVAWHAVRQAGDVRGKRVLVTGAGPIGCLVVAALRAAGAAEITVTDVHEAPLAIAKQVGATSTVRVGAGVDGLDELAADLAIESSGSPAGLRTCVYGVDRGGLVVGLGLLPPGDTPVAANALITREVRLVGSFRFDDELTDVLRALADGSLPVDPVVTSVVPAANTQAAFELAADPARSCKVLLDFKA
ncbi:L-idonate 5-dehydrogenase [Streptomyces stelliscabiei]|uniref:L-idonate 5-dehydrogenase n=1 Tax=Streptomyces stelliscabiei TaxID=146820 RepID=UPI0029B91028|nr:L-idonate 5-dehydrogenase [Streptomyces stelliscabiei]MDX2556411.1 L-idonate 5-dehydrogenase [Streptomyces stelliscabiei]MDX2615091.1 L-idonate 5-dehydrogenase [Streptomyces stelliscabiei]MDX2640304.1 L-idonate 5-dehydrogenase [Streptomyces stelliscabiei]MDX2665775.1 L-idonate 5-dehydrogenase [Streptomyces stelliscabiei]MDX2717013.1 L-idonate 5-dehydrogenase [Streptomyces stelliscabiei]